MSADQPCKNCKRATHPHFMRKYHGYCLDCFNAGVPELHGAIADADARKIVLIGGSVRLLAEDWAAVLKAAGVEDTLRKVTHESDV